MEKLITVRDVRERYGCSMPTARKYIRECNPHMEKPLVTPEWAFREWENSRVVYTPVTAEDFDAMVEAVQKGARIHVPRRR